MCIMHSWWLYLITNPNLWNLWFSDICTGFTVPPKDSLQNFKNKWWFGEDWKSSPESSPLSWSMRVSTSHRQQCQEIQERKKLIFRLIMWIARTPSINYSSKELLQKVLPWWDFGIPGNVVQLVRLLCALNFFLTWGRVSRWWKDQAAYCWTVTWPPTLTHLSSANITHWFGFSF